MSADVLNAMGDAVGSAVAKALLGGKVGFGFDPSQLGLNKNSSVSDIQNMDGVLNRLMSYADRIQAARDRGDKDAEIQITNAAINYASEADSGGNAKLQSAIDSALQSFLNAQKGQPMKLDEATVKAMAAASQEMGKAMERALKENAKTIAEAVLKAKKKDS